MQTLNDSIALKYDALNTTKHDKGNYVTIGANDTITLADNVRFCTLAPTELKQLKNDTYEFMEFIEQYNNDYGFMGIGVAKHR